MGKNDQEVVRAVLAGDKDAFGSLVVRHSARLFRVAFRITGNRADAEDAVQEAIVRGYRRLQSFEQRFSTVCAWFPPRRSLPPEPHVPERIPN
jgi:RNA polymerase sigma-70 factor, ECF subfamily